MSSKTACLLSLLVLLAPACSSLKGPDRSKMEPIRLSDLASDPDAFGKALAEDGDGILVLMKKGESLPMKLTADLKFGRIVTGRNRLVFDQDVYLYLSPNEILLSPNQVDWAPIQDTKALGEVFGIESGQFTLGFGVTRDFGPHGTVNVRTK